MDQIQIWTNLWITHLLFLSFSKIGFSSTLTTMNKDIFGKLAIIVCCCNMMVGCYSWIVSTT